MLCGKRRKQHFPKFNIGVAGNMGIELINREIPFGKRGQQLNAIAFAAAQFNNIAIYILSSSLVGKKAPVINYLF